MTLDETLEELKALGKKKMRAHNTKHGAVVSTDVVYDEEAISQIR